MLVFPFVTLVLRYPSPCFPIAPGSTASTLNHPLIVREVFSPHAPTSSSFLVTQQGAAAFIETLTVSSLKVDPDEFIAHMLAAGAMTDLELGTQVHGGGVWNGCAWNRCAGGLAGADRV